MRLVGERKACSAAVLGFYATLYLLNGLLAPPEMRDFTPMLLCLAAVYLTGFFGIVAGWFWARWYVLGLAFSGVAMAALLGFSIGLDPIVIVLGGTHLCAGVVLLGEPVAAAFEGRKDWREKWRVDENTANRLGKSVMRVGASLPYLIMAGLAPKQGMALAVGIAAVLLGATGLRAIVRMRTWGLFAVAGAAALCVPLGLAHLTQTSEVPAASIFGVLLLGAALVPFARPVARALR